MRNGRKQSSASTDSDSDSGDRAATPGASVAQARRQLVQWRDAIARQTVERPGRSLALAVGAGYLVGGGAFSRLTARVLGLGLRIGLRVAAVPIVTQGLILLGKSLFREGGFGDAQAVGDMPDIRAGNGKMQLRHTDPKETSSP